MTQTGLQSACPQCGAPLRFGGAHSLISVCAHCRSSVARVGVELSLLGQVPDLVAADTRLVLGQRGKLAKLSFELLGRVQLEQGRAHWQEWYVSWSDGSFGWLAEAQGRIILSHRFEQAVHVPPFESIQAGDEVEVPNVGTLHVQEVGEARFVSAEGELPFRPQLDRAYRFVDASVQAGGYSTLDYGTVGDDAELFMGRELSYHEAGLTSERTQLPDLSKLEARGQALDCPSCGAPLSLKSRESKSVVCPSCRTLCDVEHGKFQIISKLAQRTAPTIPLGVRGKLYGEELEIIGFMRRLFTYDGKRYVWSEYLLHGVVGYRWLSESDGHWILLKPIPQSRISALHPNRSLLFDGVNHRHFQSSGGVTSFDIQGEFYWQVRPEDQSSLDDFVAPPSIVSRETTAKEVNWTMGRYVPGEELWSQLKLPGEPPTPKGVGPCQPNPHKERARRQGLALMYGAGAVLILSVLLGLFLPRKTVLSIPVPVTGQSPITLSDPFTIAGGTHAATIEAIADGIHNAWVGLDIALINDETGQSDEINLGVSFYEGYDGGEHWSEGSSRESESIGSVPPGRYVLRVEHQTETGVSARLPDVVQVRVKHGSFLWFPLWLSLSLLGTLPLITLLRSAAFEGRRWSQSDHASTDSDD